MKAPWIVLNGLVMLIEFEGIEGLRHWERKLDRRGLTARVPREDRLGVQRDEVPKPAAPEAIEPGMCR